MNSDNILLIDQGGYSEPTCVTVRFVEWNVRNGCTQSVSAIPVTTIKTKRAMKV